METKPQAVPPRISPASPLPFFVTVVASMTVLGAGAVLYFFNPSTHGFYPVCEFHELTGLNCPGCGGTRAAYQLLHGHLLRALQDNALFILALTAMAGRGMQIARCKLRDQPAPVFLPPKWLWTFLVIAIVFTVVRNLPAFSFLSP